VDLAEIVRIEVHDREPVLDGVGIAIETSISDVQVEADTREIALAIGNLIENAVAYSDAGSTMTVSVFAEDDMAVVTVADQGTGIPARDLPRIFERFYRVEAARSRRSGGTGLGLAIVKHVVERHGGGVEVESELGAGSMFRLWLPKA
jgi:signal transduction histidine kinase